MNLELNMHVEIKLQDRWEHYTAVKREHPGRLQNKILFAAINHTLLGRLPEGITIKPACRINTLIDMSPMTKACFDHKDNKTKLSCGTLELDDIRNLEDTLKKLIWTDLDEITGLNINGYKITDTESHGFENVRILFWFTY